MDFLQAIILGLVQGIAEWFPISSLGHVALLEALFGLPDPVAFDILLHVGSLVVVVAVFRKDIMELVVGVLKRERKWLMMAAYLVIASVPVGIAGVLLKHRLDALFSSLWVIGFCFLVTAGWLFLTRFEKHHNKQVGLGSAITIGVAEATAVFPGISRSGATISTGLLLGLKRDEAIRFSFLLSIPAILGATVFLFKDITGIKDMGPAIVGTLAAMVAGVISLKTILKLIKEDKFQYFAWYCLGLGLLTLMIAFIRR